MLVSSILFILLFIFIIFTVRIKSKTIALKRIDLPDDVKSSPISKALAELIAVAGGIYLSLVMLVSFLNVSVPEKISILGINFEPLAVISIITALIQPWLVEIFFNNKK